MNNQTEAEASARVAYRLAQEALEAATKHRAKIEAELRMEVEALWTAADVAWTAVCDAAKARA